MSYSEPRLQNPASKFIDFKDGKFQYYDKQTEKNVILDLPLYFIVLDELSTISGYCEKAKSGIYSNEVHKISDEVLNVRTFKGGEQIIGFYKDISDAIARLGGRFTKSIYALLINSETRETELVNFKFRGAAFSGWIDKKFNPEKYAVGIMETYEATKGKTVYQVPVFRSFKITSELDLQARETDIKLQSYLSTYKSYQVEKETSETEVAKETIETNDEYVGIKDKIMEQKKNEPPIGEDDLPF